jgi:hypothetical protein
LHCSNERWNLPSLPEFNPGTGLGLAHVTG